MTLCRKDCLWISIKVWLCILGIALMGLSLICITLECFIGGMKNCSTSYPILSGMIFINGFTSLFSALTENSCLLWSNIILMTGSTAVVLRTLLYEMIKAYFKQKSRLLHMKYILIWLNVLVLLLLCTASECTFRGYLNQKKELVKTTTGDRKPSRQRKKHKNN